MIELIKQINLWLSKMFQIKVNKILIPTIYHTLSEAITACKIEEKRSAAVFTEIIKVP